MTTLPLPPEQFTALPLIPMPRVDMNAPTMLDALQLQLLPWQPLMLNFWWGLFICTTAYLLWRVSLRPGLAWSTEPDIALPSHAATQSANEPRWLTWFDRAFSLQEIHNDILLRWFGGAILIGYIITFASWWNIGATTVQAAENAGVRCWPFLQNCGDWLWLEMPPYGYSQPIFYAALLGLIVLAAWALVTQRLRFAHVCFGLLLLGKGYLTLQNYGFKGNFDYYHNAFAIVYLFLPHKRFFGSLMLPLFYYLSTVAKIHPSWTIGGYFGPMTLGLPFFPKGTEAIPTNLLIFMEMVVAWWLFSSRAKLQQAVFWFFVCFHLYSSILVAYRYPVTVLPVLLVFFGPYFKPFTKIPGGLSSLPGWTFAALLFGLQMIAPAIPGDEKLTTEGNFYGLYMFEANHQCMVHYTDKNGDPFRTVQDTSPRNRCDPWDFLQVAQQRYCNKAEEMPQVGLEIIHSINGGPFYKIVDEPNVCVLRYRAFGKNDWIKDASSAPMVGRPYMNYYR